MTHTVILQETRARRRFVPSRLRRLQFGYGITTIHFRYNLT
jgi:hypothetical protein